MEDILDLDQFPLDHPESPQWRALVERCRADLDADGLFNLDRFMRPEAAQRIAGALSPRFATEAFRHERKHNIYFRPDLPGLPPDHPALTQFTTSNDTLCADQLGDSPLVRLYEWPEFRLFLAAAMGMPRLYTMDDRLARVNVMSYGPEQQLNWHFDRSEFTTTLLLQAPDAGGEFVYRSELTRGEDPDYKGVARLLRGEDPLVKTLTLTPGTLNIFRGARSPHRVVPVRGSVKRVITVFSFFDRPDMRFTEAEQIGFYGRSG